VSATNGRATSQASWLLRVRTGRRVPSAEGTERLNYPLLTRRMARHLGDGREGLAQPRVVVEAEHR